MPIEPRMLTEARQEFLVELLSCNGGLSVLPSPPSLPEPHRFEGGLIYSRLLELGGRVLAPEIFRDRTMHIWLSQLNSWNLRRPPRAPDIGEIVDRTDELPGGGLEASLLVPQDAWPTCVQRLGAEWRTLAVRGVDGNGRRTTVIDFSFSSPVGTINGH
jgi:hypothetical protein